MGRISEKVFCAFCRIPRLAYTKKRISFANVVLAVSAAGVAMFLLWQTFDSRAILLFVVFLAAAEVFIQVRRRLSLLCPFCGFDPVLYLRDPGKAALKVKRSLDARKDAPQTLFSEKNPFLNLPKRPSENSHSLSLSVKRESDTSPMT